MQETRPVLMGVEPRLCFAPQCWVGFISAMLRKCSGNMWQPGCIDLIMTSPPFALVRKKTYGNADAGEYLDWFRPFAAAFRSALKPNGSMVIDIGGSWTPGQPTRSLYHYDLLLCCAGNSAFISRRNSIDSPKDRLYAPVIVPGWIAKDGTSFYLAHSNCRGNFSGQYYRLNLQKVTLRLE
jgi:DNA methylase